MHGFFASSIARWLQGVAAVALLGAAAANATPVTRLEAIESGDATPPVGADWQQRALPDNWDLHNTPPEDRVTWYRMRFRADTAESALGVYLTRVALHASVYLNGRWIGGTESGRDDFSAAARRPWLYVLPPALLTTGENELAIRVTGLPGTRSGLAPFAVGPLDEMRPAYESDYFRRVTLIDTLTVALLLLALFTAAIWWRRRGQEAALGWFSLGAMAWGMANLHTTGARVGLPEPYWGVLASVLQGLAALGMLRFALIITRREATVHARWIMAYAALGGVAATATLSGLLPRAMALWLWPLAVVPALFAWMFLRSPPRGPREPFALQLAAVALANIVMGLHDLLLYANQLDFTASPWLPYGLALLFLVIGLALVQRFAASLASVEALNATLEARVRDKHAELAASYARTRTLELAEAAANERTRLTRDMHDGMGGQLISALASVERGRLTPQQVAQVIRECIDDMRLLIDSLEPDDQDLAALLGNLRYRLEPRLAATGLRLTWHMGDRAGPPDLGPRERLQVLRVVQEALTNVMKHAGASEVMVGSSETGEVFVRDNGRGLRSAAAGRGRGMGNMSRRAGAARAALSVESGEGGTEVRLTWQ